MEKDISLIVDVDLGEAEELIKLIELLMKDWYINQHERQVQLDAVLAIKGRKDAIKQPSPLNPPDQR